MTATSASDPARPPTTASMPAPAANTGPPVALAGTPVVLALFIVALALRPQLSAIGPLVPEVLAEFGPSHAFVGLLTAIPVCCMGLFALAGPPVAARFGTRGGVVLSVAILIASGILRALVPGAELVLLATFGIGVGTAVIGPIFAMFVRDRMPTQLVGGTSSYAGGTIVGAALGAAFAVPLAAALGGWRGAMLAISVLSIACLVTWVIVVRGRPSPNAASAGPRRLERPRLPVRRGIVWAIAILFGLQSWLYYGQTAWLASVYIELGWAPGAAAVLLSIVSIASLGAIVLAPAGARRGLSRRVMLTAAAVSSTSGLLGVALVPAPGVLWAILLGFGLGMMFTLLLTLPTDLSHDPREVGGASALMLLVGYLLAALAPSALGAVRDATGEFGPAIWLLVGIAVVMIPLSWSLTPLRIHGHVDAA